MSTPTQAIEAIHVLTQKAQALQAPAQHINQIHGTLMVIGQGPFPQILAGLREIVTIAAADVQQMMNMKAVAAGSESSMMFDAYRAFVQVNQALFNTLIGKAGLFSAMPMVGEPVAHQLRSVEGLYDTLAFIVIDKVQDRANDLKTQAQSLAETTTKVIDAYNNLAVTT